MRHSFKTQAGSLLPAWVILFLSCFALGCFRDPGISGPDAVSKTVSSQPECDDCPSAKVLPDPEPGPEEMVNPVFLSWRIYPEGTNTVRLTREADGSEVRELTRLLEKKEQKITLSVEVTRVGKGKTEVTKPQVVMLSYLIPKNGSSTGRNLDATPGKVEVLGKTFASFLSESSGNDSLGAFVTRRWDSDTIPGLLIRQEKQTTPAGGGAVRLTVTELVELKFPKWDAK